jgi:omega-amidase
LGEILAAGEPFARARLDAELSLDDLQAYRERFPAWRDADGYTLK